MSGHWIGACFLLLLGLFGVWQALLLPLGGLRSPGPGFFPLWISVILCGLALLTMLSLWAARLRRPPPIQWPSRSTWLRIGCSLAIFTGYAFALEPLGYLLSTFLLVGGFVKAVFGRSWLSSGLLAAGAVLASDALFEWLLGVQLPALQWW